MLKRALTRELDSFHFDPPLPFRTWIVRMADLIGIQTVLDKVRDWIAKTPPDFYTDRMRSQLWASMVGGPSSLVTDPRSVDDRGTLHFKAQCRDLSRKRSCAMCIRHVWACSWIARRG